MFQPYVFSFIRLISAIIFLPFLLFFLLPLDDQLAHYFLVIFFCFLVATDIFDNFFISQTKLHVQSFDLLDKLADNSLIIISLILFLTLEKIHFFWVVIFTARELIVMGLDSIVLLHQKKISIGYFDTLKTLIQYGYIIVALGGSWSCNSKTILFIENTLLYTALILSVLSGFIYCIKCYYLFSLLDKKE